MEVNTLISNLIPNDSPETVFATPGGDLGKDEFLKLLIAQMTNQDPLNPMQGADLAVQLAQFSSVEQLVQLNDNLEGQFAVNDRIAEALSGSTSAGLIGREVIALGDQIEIDGNGATDVTFRVAGAGNATLRVIDESGATVATKSLGQVATGRHDESVDLSEVPAGSYRYVVEVSDAEGVITPAQTFMRGIVRGLRFEQGRAVLLVGTNEVAMEDVIEVTIADSSST